MGLLDAPKLNKTQAKAKVRTRVITGVRGLFDRMLNEFVTDVGLVWQNEDGLTPDEALEALGPDGVEIFRLAAILKDAINAAKPNTITQVTPDVIPHADGTIVRQQ
jgi:hypothetical protein